MTQAASALLLEAGPPNCGASVSNNLIARPGCSGCDRSLIVPKKSSTSTQGLREFSSVSVNANSREARSRCRARGECSVTLVASIEACEVPSVESSGGILQGNVGDARDGAGARLAVSPAIGTGACRNDPDRVDRVGTASAKQWSQLTGAFMPCATGPVVARAGRSTWALVWLSDHPGSDIKSGAARNRIVVGFC